MKNNLLFFIFYLLVHIHVYGQIQKDSVNKIDEVIIESQRLAMPFAKKSHTISVMTAEEIKLQPAKSLDEILQQISGVDVRRRGVEGMQSDLYIRGGSFNQVLLLIDGIKMDDMQTGHHTMNGIVSLDNIERIEVIKGAAARIYGQNAMNGAINIVTKKVNQDKVKVNLNVGSFGSIGANFGVQQLTDNASVLFQVNKQQSEGYRYNTDFENWNAFFKTNWNEYEVLVSYGQRKFGANGFYASTNFKDQYEETQTHLVSLSRRIQKSKWNIDMNSYWRRNQDMYLFLRHDPNFYRNLHINNKIGLAVNATNTNKLGKTALGVDLNQGYLVSNNLGDHHRFSTTIFLEHRFQWLENKLDLTPGIAFAYFSDFKEFIYPGIDIGYRFSKHFKLYSNFGYTSRIPTYTNLYYESSIEEGNPNLKPEKAQSFESGFYMSFKNTHLNLAYFDRISSDLIDWTKDTEEAKWQARNFSKIHTQGLEFQGKYNFYIKDLTQHIKINYTYLNDVILDNDIEFSRYSLNSFKHQFNVQLETSLIPNMKQTISYRYVERTDGVNHQLVDVALNFLVKNWQLGAKANNIFDEIYTETLVPMPKANFSASVTYTF